MKFYKMFLILLTLNILIINNLYGQHVVKSKYWLEDIDYMVGRLEAQHPNLYANVSKNKFLKDAEELKSKVTKLTDNQIVFGIHKLLATLKDAHTGIAPWESKDPKVLSYYKMYPVLFYQFSDGIFIKAVSEKYKSILGYKVLKFGKLDSKELLKRLMKLTNGDNYNGRLALCDLYFSLAGALDYCGVGLVNNRLTLTLLNNEGKKINYTVEPMEFFDVIKLIISSRNQNKSKGIYYLNSMSNKPLPLYLSNTGENYWYKYIKEQKTMFVYLKTMQPKSPGDFERFYKEVLKEFDKTGAKNLVLDIRNNGGGDHFELPLLKGVIARPKLDKSDKLFIIIGRITCSASQHFATQFDIYTNATFIGENTGGRPNHYGAQRFFLLPNSKLPVRVSQIYHQDTTEWDMADCTRPDFYVHLSSEDYRNNEDPALDFIYKFEKVKKVKKEFKDKLSIAYQKGGYDALEKEYYIFKNDKKYSNVNKGMLINDFLYWLLPNKKSIEDYKKFLTLFTKECPDWTESWYALARRNELAGNINEAEKLYKKSLKVFSGNTLAERRLRLMLFKKAYKLKNKINYF